MFARGPIESTPRHLRMEETTRPDALGIRAGGLALRIRDYLSSTRMNLSVTSSIVFPVVFVTLMLGKT